MQSTKYLRAQGSHNETVLGQARSSDRQVSVWIGLVERLKGMGRALALNGPRGRDELRSFLFRASS